MSTLSDKFAALANARQARASAQAQEHAATTALFSQADPNDEMIKPGQVVADSGQKIAYANIDGHGQIFELVMIDGTPVPPAS